MTLAKVLFFVNALSRRNRSGQSCMLNHVLSVFENWRTKGRIAMSASDCRPNSQSFPTSILFNCKRNLAPFCYATRPVRVADVVFIKVKC